MIVILLAAGRGARMGSLTKDRPKPLIKCKGKITIDYAIDAAIAAGAQKILIVIGYFGDLIREHVRRSYELSSIEFVFVEQTTLDGTASAVSLCLSTVQGLEQYDNILVSACDYVVPRSEYRSLMQFRSATNSDLSMFIREVSSEEARAKNVVKLGENNMVRGLIEKPSVLSGERHYSARLIYATTGPVIALSRDVLMSDRGEFELPTIINLAVERGFRVSAIAEDNIDDLKV